jgi:hypothetical protein
MSVLSYTDIFPEQLPTDQIAEQRHRQKRYPYLIKQYEQYLKQREGDGKITERTRKQYFNDAQRVMETLVASLPADDIKVKVGLLYRGYFGNIVKDLKAIVDRRHR